MASPSAFTPALLTPLRPPKPLLLKPREVDALYDTLEAVLAALAALTPPAPAVLLAGSALGAVRSASILFCDDDVDIGILEEDAERVAAALPGALRSVASYARRPWPGGDRIRPRAAPSAWIDVFVLRRYDSAAELEATVSRRDNGSAAAPAAVAAMRAGLEGATYPLWHYDSRLALELWPREWLSSAELFPLRVAAFGPLVAAPLPARPVPYLQRSFGLDCFEVYKLARQHEAFSGERAAAGAAVGPAVEAAPLEEHHFLPLQHSRRARRVASGHCRAALVDFLAAEARWDGALPAGTVLPPPLLRAPAERMRAWFGEALAEATGRAPGAFSFTPEILRVMEPHLAKARTARAVAAAVVALREPLPEALLVETLLPYDALAHPLGGALADALGLPPGTDLSFFHEAVGGTPAGKHAATARLRCAESRAGFCAAYARFLEAVVCPSVAAGAALPAGCALTHMRVQSFPCVRLLQPGEFSLAPHCDADRAFAPATLNFVVPLTPYEPAAGAAALHLESRPGLEDWHPCTAGPGQALRFYGNRCIHWTSTNTTDRTRASLDVRVALGDAHTTEGEPFASSYFARFCLREDGTWDCEGLHPPDYRVGYPFAGIVP